MSNALKTHREAAGETCKALCERIGFGTYYASVRRQASRGADRITDEREPDWFRLCQALNIHPADCFADADAN